MGEACPKHCVLLLQLVVASKHLHHLARAVGVELGCQVADLSFELVDVVFGSLSDRSLCFSVVGSLAFQLGSCERRHAAGAGSRRSLLAVARGRLPLGARGVVLVGRRSLHSGHVGRDIVGGIHEVAGAVGSGIPIM